MEEQYALPKPPPPLLLLPAGLCHYQHRTAPSSLLAGLPVELAEDGRGIFIHSSHDGSRGLS